MAIKSKKRIYISVSPDMEEILKLMSEENNVPVATTASILLKQGMEIEEDIYWNQIAEERKKEKGKLYTHEEVWK